ncbi:hypothetical protein P7K49_009075 [Saguinus oedipus]|uniref:Uncharacterized protein n=1 Tax=Saguinus oedipus TaxID=9490 RepID=A0ABQ9VZI3_SAGOE|nr:hypothetical protein P7K49_009075 [Saguinus oedipus]
MTCRRPGAEALPSTSRHHSAAIVNILVLGVHFPVLPKEISVSYSFCGEHDAHLVRLTTAAPERLSTEVVEAAAVSGFAEDGGLWLGGSSRFVDCRAGSPEEREVLPCPRPRLLLAALGPVTLLVLLSLWRRLWLSSELRAAPEKPEACCFGLPSTWRPSVRNAGACLRGRAEKPVRRPSPAWVLTALRELSPVRVLQGLSSDITAGDTGKELPPGNGVSVLGSPPISSLDRTPRLQSPWHMVRTFYPGGKGRVSSLSLWPALSTCFISGYASQLPSTLKESLTPLRRGQKPRWSDWPSRTTGVGAAVAVAVSAGYRPFTPRAPLDSPWHY